MSRPFWPKHTPAGRSDPQRVFAFNGGTFTNTRVRRILRAAGLKPTVGWPKSSDAVLAWGHSPISRRAEWVSEKTGARLIRIEDAFFRSVLTGREGDAPMGLIIDRSGCHFDPRQPSDLEKILTTAPLSQDDLLGQADRAMSDITRWELSKYNAFPPNAPQPKPGYVLVVDQTKGDAAVTLSGATQDTFRDLLAAAHKDFPDTPVLIKTHPETNAGLRQGYFSSDMLRDGDILWDHPTSPQALFAGAVAVYVVSSQLGFEAILAGHKPIVFGQPFYAGWGLTKDRNPIARRKRKLTAQQLFAGACLMYPRWYDPSKDQLCDFQTALHHLQAQKSAWQQDHRGWDAHGMRLWKRQALTRAFGRYAPIRFDPETPSPDTPAMTWGAKAGPMQSYRLEDGFLRSKGLGAALVPPMSLVLDDIGIYFDATQPSRLEHLIAASRTLPQSSLKRAAFLRDKIVAAGLSKYNLSKSAASAWPDGFKVLVPGQVEDDASIQFGAVDITTNEALLKAARAQYPDATIIYKPHPDVAAGLRPGHVPNATDLADLVLTEADPIEAINACDRVCTITSLLGFEALLRSTPVTCFGHPFYAGWGLTDDAAPHARRTKLVADKAVDMLGLVHATLIDYPRYFDPKTGDPCPVEVIVDRLSDPDQKAHQGQYLRILSKVQGAFATYAHLWRG